MALLIYKLLFCLSNFSNSLIFQTLAINLFIIMVATRSGGRQSTSSEPNREASPQATMNQQDQQLELQRVRDELEHYKVLLETEKSSALRKELDTEQSLNEQESKINEIQKQLDEKSQFVISLIEEKDQSS